MPLISFISQTGNIGKSVLATALAVESVNNGLPVAIADLDHEHLTSHEILQDRKNAGIEPIFTVYTPETAKEALSCFKEGDKLKIIDCPSRASKATIEVSKKSDLVVQPTTCSKKDMDRCIETFYTLSEHNISVEKMLIVINRVGTEAEYRRALGYLKQVQIEGKTIPIVSTCIYEKQNYRNALNDGFSIIETASPSLNEVARSVIHQILSSTLK
jgi:cellulose biosynthesis protein BcsQ